MSPNPTLQAAREAIRAALTSPQLAYTKDTGSGDYTTLTLPTANVVPRSIWLLGDTPPPSPFICFAIAGRGETSRKIASRHLVVTFWVVGDTEDEVTFLYEAVRARVHTGDQDAGFFTSDMSRTAMETNLGVVFRQCVERATYPPDFDKTTARWQLVAEYTAEAL